LSADEAPSPVILHSTITMLSRQSRADLVAAAPAMIALLLELSR